MIRRREVTFRILLAEDNAVNQQVALGLLETFGYRAHAVADGTEALAALNRTRYDIILMDCQMPQLDGYETTRRIRQFEEKCTAPFNWRTPIHIIAMTAHAIKGDREKCLGCGMDDYLSKPVRRNELKAALDRHGKIGGVALFPDNVLAPPVDMLVDIDHLREIAHNQRDQIQQLIELYLIEAAPLLLGLDDAIQANSSGDVARIAHEFVGCSLFCGVEAFTHSLRELERLGHEGNLAGARPLLADIRQKFPRVQNVFSQLVQTLQPSHP